MENENEETNNRIGSDFSTTEAVERNTDAGNDVHANSNDFVAEFKKEAQELSPINEKETKKETDNNSGDIPDDLLETVSVEELLLLLPPDTLSSITSPSLWLAEKAVSKDLDPKTQKAIGSLFKTSERTIEIKKKLWGKVIRRYFPDFQGRINPLYALMIHEFVMTMLAVKEAKEMIKEIAYIEPEKVK